MDKYLLMVASYTKVDNVLICNQDMILIKLDCVEIFKSHRRFLILWFNGEWSVASQYTLTILKGDKCLIMIKCQITFCVPSTSSAQSQLNYAHLPLHCPSIYFGVMGLIERYCHIPSSHHNTLTLEASLERCSWHRLQEPNQVRWELGPVVWKLGLKILGTQESGKWHDVCLAWTGNINANLFHTKNLCVCV